MMLFRHILRIFVGLVLLTVGGVIIYGVWFIFPSRGHDIADIGFLLLAEAYALIGILFILLGARYTFRGQPFVEHLISKSLRHFIGVIAILFLFTLAVIIFNRR